MTGFEGLAAIVTGGASGIGLATTRLLAAHGANVAALDRNPEPVEEPVVGIGCDVTDTASVDAAFSEVEAAHGPVEVLVANAGVTKDTLLMRMSDDDWDTVMRVHLRGAFLMSRACQSYMVDAGFGRIVNLSSSSALGNRGQVNYAAAKAGMQGFTKTLAKELGKFGITANAVAPGFVVTDMTAQTAARVGVSFEELQAAAAEKTAVKRVGRPEDIANAIAFFASDQAGYVSGQVLYVAGGPLN